MPAADVLRSDEKERDKDRDLDRSDRGGSKSKSSASSASKSAKDLSHVPCKFFKVGGCTAGSSCPFSHNLPEPGHKEVCTWFVKGNCKFGHKCALAHILPGQNMSMDRKNKKAAQLAANAGAGADKGAAKDVKGGRANDTKRDSATPSGNRSLLTGGSTAPTRLLNSSSTAGRPPMSVLKASTSPSAPAPPLASLGVLEDLDNENIQLLTAPAQGKQGSQAVGTASTTNPADRAHDDADSQSQSKSPSPGPLPMSLPRSVVTPTQPKPDFGPIGSPPTSGSLSSKMNQNADITPGTSPQHITGISVIPESPVRTQSFVPSSPFSAPSTQTNFMGGNSYNGVGGIASSLSALTIIGGRKGGWSNGAGENGNGVSSQRHLNGGQHDVLKRGVGMGILGGQDLETAVEDGDMEDFLPSSLTDLLTPEERQRRMSRSHSGQTANSAAPIGHLISQNASHNQASSGNTGHRYSRSVPATSLLGDLKSIWSDNPNGHALPSSPSHRATPSSSFTQRFDPLGHNAADDMGLSISVGSSSSGIMGLSPSNASAAFLPGLHTQYLNAKAKQAQAAQLGIGTHGRGVRGISGPLYSGNTGTSLNNNNNFAGSSFSSNAAVHTHTNPITNVQHTYRTTPSPFDLTQQAHLYPQTARPIPSNLSSTATKNGAGEDPHQGSHLLSPGARALQSHAPGQSLPQGLAAGYSRIHALPPPPSIASPSSAGLFGSGTPPVGLDISIPSSGPYGQWKGAASPSAGGGGFDSMFSRLTYSATAARPGQASSASTPVPAGQGAGANGPPPGLSRTVSGGKQSTGPLSPLSKPATHDNDDDDLFILDR